MHTNRIYMISCHKIIYKFIIIFFKLISIYQSSPKFNRDNLISVLYDGEANRVN